MTKLMVANLQVWAWLLTVFVGMFVLAALYTARAQANRLESVLESRRQIMDGLAAHFAMLEANQNKIIAEQQRIEAEVKISRNHNRSIDKRVDASDRRQDKSDIRQDASQAREKKP